MKFLRAVSLLSQRRSWFFRLSRARRFGPVDIFRGRAIFPAGDTFRTKEFSVHCDAHFSNVGKCNLCGALYVHTDESDGYQKNFPPLALCAREYFTRFPDFHGGASWLIVGSENSTCRSFETVLSTKRPNRSLEQPFYTASYDQRRD